MHTAVKTAIDTFVILLPGYLPQGVGNPNDYSRWLKVCVLSAHFDSPIDYDYLRDAIQERFNVSANEDVEQLVANCREEYESLSTLLDYLVSRGLLTLPADLNF
ncbi:MAG: hypothetical protein NC333_07495 [Terasakiella sp.]|nr:hypothetical protein [Terasakiella sp.]